MGKRPSLTPEEKRERRKETCRQWRERNPEKCKERQRRYRERHRERIQAHHSAYHRGWYLLNRAKCLARSQSWYEANKEKSKANHAAWVKKNPKRRRQITRNSTRKYRQKLRAMKGLPLYPPIVRAIVELLLENGALPEPVIRKETGLSPRTLRELLETWEYEGVMRHGNGKWRAGAVSRRQLVRLEAAA